MAFWALKLFSSFGLALSRATTLPFFFASSIFFASRLISFIGVVWFFTLAMKIVFWLIVRLVRPFKNFCSSLRLARCVSRFILVFLNSCIFFSIFSAELFWFVNLFKNRFLFSWFKFAVAFSIFFKFIFFLSMMRRSSLFLSFRILFMDSIELSSLDMSMLWLSARFERFFLLSLMYALLIFLFKLLTLFLFLIFTLILRFKLFFSCALRIRSVIRFFSPEIVLSFLAFSRRVFMLRGLRLKFFMIVSISPFASLRSSLRYLRSATSFSRLNSVERFEAWFFTLMTDMFG